MNRRTKFLAGLLVTAVFALPAGAAEPAQPAERAPTITQTELLSKLDRKDADVVVLDVRTAAEFAAGHVPGARNVSHDELPARLEELAALRDKPVVLYCRSGRRTQIAEDTLRKAGFTKLLHLEGDWLAWEAAKRPVER
jgi:phage shock protein E